MAMIRKTLKFTDTVIHMLKYISSSTLIHPILHTFTSGFCAFQIFIPVELKKETKKISHLASKLIHYLQYNSELPAPHHISKLPPIDSDLYTQPSDSLSHLNFDSYSLPGTV